MQLARAAGFRTASVERAVTTSGLPYLVVERYDRDLTVEPIRRLHQEDLCQALGVPADSKYQSEGGPGVRACTELLRDSTGAPALELPRFWDALVLNWLIGNCDGHAKNFSLLYDHGAPTLAPLYDLVSTTAYDWLTTRLAMSIGGATRIEDVDLGSWLRLATEAGFSERFARRTTARVVARVKEEAARLAADAAHENPAAHQIAERVAALTV
jgi:serine/threonine-protein kinase HipA